MMKNSYEAVDILYVFQRHGILTVGRPDPLATCGSRIWISQWHCEVDDINRWFGARLGYDTSLALSHRNQLVMAC